MLFSCKKSEEKIEIIFYKGDISSHIPLTCSDFNTKEGSSILTLHNDSLVKEINDCIELSIIDTKKINNIDVRFKVIINQDTLCMDNFGQFILNNNLYGKLKCYNKIIEIIDDNHDKASFINANIMEVDIE